jgi:hypothetical protein
MTPAQKRQKRKKALSRKGGILDKTWSRAVIVAADGCCAICGIRPDRPNPHHLIRKSRGKRFRWVFDNGVCLCFTHHTGGAEAAHAGGLAFAEAFQEKYPERAAWYSQANRDNKVLGPWKPSLEELEEIRKELEEIIEDLS